MVGACPDHVAPKLLNQNVSYMSLAECAPSDYTFYEPRFFDRSVTYRSWVKLFISDIYRLKVKDGYESTGARFWKNHPIRWLQVVGIVISVTIKASFAEIEVDDGSGSCISVFLKGTVAESIEVDYEHNRCNLELTSLVKVKGTVALDHKGDLQLIATRIDRVEDGLVELSAWEERLALLRNVLDKPWKLPAHILETSTTGGKADVDNDQSLSKQATTRESANSRLRAREEARKASTLNLSELDRKHHTQKTLKVVLLQYFKEHDTRDFSVLQLRSVPVLVTATSLVATQSIRSKRVATGQLADDEDLSISSAQKYRTLNACLAELVRDGSIIPVNVDKGHYSVVGQWNLGALMKDQMAAIFAAEPGKTEVTVKELWQHVRAVGNGFESISKQKVQQLMNEMLT